MINRTLPPTQPLTRPALDQGQAASRAASNPPQTGTVQAPTGTTAQQVSMFSAQLSQVSTELKQRLLQLDRLRQHSQQVMNFRFNRKLHAALEGQATALRQTVRSEGGLEQIHNSARDDPGQHALVGLIRIAEQQARHAQAAGEVMALQALRRQLDERAKRHLRPLRAGMQFNNGINDPKRRASARSLTGSGLLGMLELTQMITEREDEGAGFKAQLSDLQMDANHYMATASPLQQQESMKNLARTTFLKQFYTSCDHLRSAMLEKNPELQMKTSAFMKVLQQLIGNGMQPKETLQLVQNVAGRQLKNQLALVNRLLALLKELKYMTWNDSKSRQKALDNLLILSTALVNEEQKRLQETLA